MFSGEPDIFQVIFALRDSIARPRGDHTVVGRLFVGLSVRERTHANTLLLDDSEVPTPIVALTRRLHYVVPIRPQLASDGERYIFVGEKTHRRSRL